MNGQKDIFLFTSCTGLSFGYISILTDKLLVERIDGNNWIYTSRAKTHESIKTPTALILLWKLQQHVFIDSIPDIKGILSSYGIWNPPDIIEARYRYIFRCSIYSSLT